MLAKLSMLLIDNEAEFKAEFNLPSHAFMKEHTHTHRHTQCTKVITKVTLMHTPIYEPDFLKSFSPTFALSKNFKTDVFFLSEDYLHSISTWHLIILGKALDYVIHQKVKL